MALFGRLFPTKAKFGFNRESRDFSRSCAITSEQVRLLLFKECDWRGRKLLFDSSTIQKAPASKNDKICTKPKNSDVPCIVEISGEYAYWYKGAATDASALGEMIFGAVSMNCKGVSLKIHIIDEPRRLLCTKVFCVPVCRNANVSRKDSKAYSDSLQKSEIALQKAIPFDKARQEEGLSLSFSFDRGDSGFYGDHSPHSSVSSTNDYCTMFDNWDGVNSQEDFYSFHSPSGRKLSTCSNGSWQRKTFRSISRFDLGYQSTNLLSIPTASNTTNCDSQIYSNSSTSGTCDSFSSTHSSNAAVKKSKLGLALLITVTDSTEVETVQYCMQHSPHLEALVCRLRLAVMASGAKSSSCAGSSFVSTLYHATSEATKWLSDLLYSPKLQPVWLNLVNSQQTAANKIAESLLSDFCSVLAAGDTKHTNFFISTLLTHVLTYHLGWVTTVSPYDRTTSQSDKKQSDNALWTQLEDLNGSIGTPPRVSRTILCGTNNTQFLNKILTVLTYFIRCGDVHKSTFELNKNSIKEGKITNVIEETVNKSGLKRSKTRIDKLVENNNTQNMLKASVIRSCLSDPLSSTSNVPRTSQLKKKSAILSKASLSSSSDSSEYEEKVVFVLGDDEKLIGLKNKSNGKSLKKTQKGLNDSEKADSENCDKSERAKDSPSKCCGQLLQHSKPMKHSGFKFEFDKYPQIVTNYMKSKNLEILDRHYLGKPGNLKLDNFQFDPTVVPPIQEERCEICYQCQLMESTLQTPTNASELEFMNDMPGQSEPQYAREAVVENVSPISFVRKRKENTVVVNVVKCEESLPDKVSSLDVRKIIEIPMAKSDPVENNLNTVSTGFHMSLLGGVTDHYVPDLILQGTLARPSVWESDLKRDLNLMAHLNMPLDLPLPAIAIIADINEWEVRFVGRECVGGTIGMSALVAAMLDALPHMWKARVPAHQCLSYLEFKLREFCVMSKTLADMLMTTDFCDMSTLTKSLNIDVNDVPLLMAVATTHTPQVARRYGISYR